MGLKIGDSVEFKKAIDSQGITVGACGVVVSATEFHSLLCDEYLADVSKQDECVYVAVFGKCLVLPMGYFLNEDIGSVDGVAENRAAGQPTVGAGAANGQGDETGTMDGSAIAGAEHYSIKKAVADLAQIAAQLSIDESSDSGVSEEIFSIAEKLKNLAA